VTVRTTPLPAGETVPVLGQGTWYMGEDRRQRTVEVAALRLGLDLGLSLIDTAEMYADGGAEEVVGDALAGRRDEVFLVSKVMPSHATRAGTIAACEASLRRLGTDRIDLYLLHWPGAVPLADTLAGFSQLQRAGKIRYWGVSNFDMADMAAVLEMPGGDQVQTNQVLYNLSRRGIEFDLLPSSQERGMPIMAYSPVEQGRLLRQPVLRQLAADHGVSPAQVALAWVLRHDHVIAIPKASAADHVRENYAALDLHLTQADLELVDRAFPPPGRAVPLEVL
jgi:diketogulonate reductase-like aldo/keto reductase